MPINTWMIYGAAGYSGRSIAENAIKKDLRPILAGRPVDNVPAVAGELGLECREFTLDDHAEVVRQLKDVDALISTAGPFSATAEPLVRACIEAKTHYFDITGEPTVFEFVHSAEINDAATAANVTVCSGIGFDVIPTDCLAKALVETLPDATHLHLGFAGEMALSPGTAKSMIEGLALGTMARRDGKIVTIPLEVRDIDYGNGPRQSMSVSWGDISTAFHTTGIPNITVSWPATNAEIRQARFAAWIRPIIRLGWVQNYLKKQVEKRVVGPDAATRARADVLVWGEARNATGDVVSARVTTANGYTLTFDAPPLIIQYLLDNAVPAGSQTPANVFGKDLVSLLPGSSEIEIRSGE